MSKKNENCGVCGGPRSKFVLNNKRVCLKCDDLLFDLEIECEELEQRPTLDRTTAVTGQTKPLPTLKKA